jgi:ABC-type molybdate transport system ATPase subunit
MNEIRYYLNITLEAMTAEEEQFKPQYIVTAVKLPTGAIELAVNNSAIKEKIEYILEAYDDDMHLKTNPAISMENILIV